MNNVKLIFLFALGFVLTACSTTPEPQTDIVYENIPAAEAEAVVDDGIPRVYTVQKGDTVAKIARRFGLDYREIAQMNSLRKYRIYPGQKLRLK